MTHFDQTEARLRLARRTNDRLRRERDQARAECDAMAAKLVAVRQLYRGESRTGDNRHAYCIDAPDLRAALDGTKTPPAEAGATADDAAEGTSGGRGVASVPPRSPDTRDLYADPPDGEPL